MHSLFASLLLAQDVWHGRGLGRWRLRRGGERGGVLDRGGSEDAAPSRGPQWGQCVGQPQGQVWLRGLRGSSHPLGPVCHPRQCFAPGSGLLGGAAARSAAAVRWFLVPLQGEILPCCLFFLQVLYKLRGNIYCYSRPPIHYYDLSYTIEVVKLHHLS